MLDKKMTDILGSLDDFQEIGTEDFTPFERSMMMYKQNYQNGGYQQSPNSTPSSGALDWDSEIEGKVDFELIPEGDYCFKVQKVDRGWFNGSEKMCPCNQAIVYLEIIVNGEIRTLKEYFLLHERTIWKTANLYASIGLITQEGEKVRMNWGAVPNRTGICHIGFRKYQGTDGQEHQTNEIKKFYAVYSDKLPNPFNQNYGGWTGR